MDSRIVVWARRLQESDANVRAEAIRSLEALGDGAALPILAEVFARDENPVIRELAQWAGKSIYYNLHRRAQVVQGSSEEERRRAAEILEKARAKKLGRR